MTVLDFTGRPGHLSCNAKRTFGGLLPRAAWNASLQAIDRGEGSGSDWGEFEQRLKQAESDALTFNAAKQQALEAKKASP